MASSTSGMKSAARTPDAEPSKVSVLPGRAAFRALKAGVVINTSPRLSSRMQRMFRASCQQEDRFTDTLEVTRPPGLRGKPRGIRGDDQPRSLVQRAHRVMRQPARRTIPFRLVAVVEQDRPAARPAAGLD